MMRLTIIGYGNQARAWAENLRDSGYAVTVALRPQSSSATLVKEKKFPLVEIGSDEFYQSEMFALLTPDDSHLSFLEQYGNGFRKGSIILYAHGFSMTKWHLPQLFPDCHHVLFAPKAIATELRKEYLAKGKLGAVYSVEYVQNNKEIVRDTVLKLATALGINMGPYLTSAERETKADLYSEQGLLCSLIPYTAAEMFQHLVESGTEPELAYFECWLELKLIINAMVDKGPEGFFDLISPNALIGSEKGYHRLITPEFKQNLRSLLTDIEKGTFDQELDKTDVTAVREVIKKRWQRSSLMSTFETINRKTP